MKGYDDLGRMCDLKLHKTRKGTRAREQLGEFYLVNEKKGGVVKTHVDVVALGRALGVLKPYEVVEG